MAVEAEGEDAFVLGGRVSLATLAELLDLELATTSSYTIGGLMNQRLGRVAVVGDSTTLEDWSVQVIEASGSEIRKVRLHRIDRSKQQR